MNPLEGNPRPSRAGRKSVNTRAPEGSFSVLNPSSVAFLFNTLILLSSI